MKLPRPRNLLLLVWMAGFRMKLKLFSLSRFVGLAEDLRKLKLLVNGAGSS